MSTRSSRSELALGLSDSTWVDAMRVGLVAVSARFSGGLRLAELAAAGFDYRRSHEVTVFKFN
jgi:hypothetical protein